MTKNWKSINNKEREDVKQEMTESYVHAISRMRH